MKSVNKSDKIKIKFVDFCSCVPLHRAGDSNKVGGGRQGLILAPGGSRAAVTTEEKLYQEETKSVWCVCERERVGGV